MKSNRVQDLRDVGVNIWNDWERQDGTIGHAYGYVLRKKCRRLNGGLVDQVDMLLHELRHNPASRRHIVTLRHIQLLAEQLTFPQYQAPTLWMNPNIKSFYDFTIDDFQLLNYKHGPLIRMELAI